MSTKEIVSVSQADQFVPGRSEFECVAYACSVARSMAKAGQPPAKSSQWVSDTAQAEYAKYEGNDDASNENGMSVPAEYAVLHDLDLHYQGLTVDSKVKQKILGWLDYGEPLVLTIAEASVFDLGLNKNPYPWTPAGNHAIFVSGHDANNNLLVHDTANVESLDNPTSLRPGPRTYALERLEVVSATVVVPPWMPRPASETPPPPPSSTTKENTSMVPSGWKDDGTALVAPNTIKVVHGFREYILSHPWDAENWPLEEEHTVAQQELSNPSLGSGSQQAFRWTVLEWTPARDVYCMWTGQELLATRTALAAAEAAAQAGKSLDLSAVHSFLVALVNATQPLADANQQAQAILKEF
jgi:hypothetical protein